MKTNIVPFTEVEDKIIAKAKERRESIAQRYPLTFALVGTFGFVCTLYGFEKLIDSSELLSNNPWILLVVGLGTLSVTGLALRKLS